MEKHIWTEKDISDQEGKRMIITGANSGIGFLAAKVLAGKKAEVILAVRNEEKGNAAGINKVNENYHSMEAYKQSKLANLLFAYELQRRFESSVIQAISIGTHPGYSRTNLHSVDPQMSGSHIKGAMLKMISVFAQSAEMGKLPTLYAATSSGIQGGDYIGPNRFFGMRGYPESVKSSQLSKDVELAQRLWKVSEEMTCISYLSKSR